MEERLGKHVTGQKDERKDHTVSNVQPDSSQKHGLLPLFVSRCRVRRKKKNEPQSC